MAPLPASPPATALAVAAPALTPRRFHPHRFSRRTCFLVRCVTHLPITHLLTLMTLILIIIVGGLIGWIASKVMGTDPEQGIFLNIIVGIVGALLGGFLAGLLGITEESIVSGDFSLGALLISFLGAILLVWIVKMIRGRT